jgi:ferredoxin-NADP reductase
VKVQTWPGKVLNLVLHRPRQFDYRAGQYAFIRCPTISFFQWHPFTITSSPGTPPPSFISAQLVSPHLVEPEEHTISFHIRVRGEHVRD